MIALHLQQALLLSRVVLPLLLVLDGCLLLLLRKVQLIILHDRVTALAASTFCVDSYLRQPCLETSERKAQAAAE